MASPIEVLHHPLDTTDDALRATCEAHLHRYSRAMSERLKAITTTR